jgi:hypothetical protein
LGDIYIKKIKMKYIITENKLHSLITKVLTKEFPEIVEIDFGSKKVMLASKTEKFNPGDTIEVTIIKVTVDNRDRRIMFSDLKEMYSDIRKSVDSYFTLGMEEYGSPYDLELYVLEKNKKFG